MTTSLFVKRGDTAVRVRVNMDVTGSTVKAFTRPRGSETSTEHAVTVVNAAAGELDVATAALAADRYALEVEVTQAGKVITFPDDGYAVLTITEDLG